jgi:hypothetical protein
MVDLEGTLSNVNFYCLSTVGAINMISEAGESLAVFSDNVNVFTDNIALFQLAAGSGGSSPTSTTSSVPTTMSTSTKTTTSPTGTAGWTLLGCYTDNVGGRTLVNGEAVPGGAGAMTVEACQSTCLGLGYSLAGVEYADECCKCHTTFSSLALLTVQIVAIPSPTAVAQHLTETHYAIWPAQAMQPRLVVDRTDWIYIHTAAEHLQPALRLRLPLQRLPPLDGISEDVTPTAWAAGLWDMRRVFLLEQLQ